MLLAVPRLAELEFLTNKLLAIEDGFGSVAGARGVHVNVC